MRCQHVVHIFFFSCIHTVLLNQIVIRWPRWGGLRSALYSPELGNSAQLVLEHLVVLINQGAHVSLEATGCIDRAHRETKFDIVFRIRADDEVNVTPVGQESPLDVAHNVWKCFLVHIFQGLIALGGYEITVQLFRVFDPTRTQNFKCIRFIWVVLA